MSESLLNESISAMDERLRDLASSFPYPSTPDLTSAIRRRLTTQARRPAPVHRVRQAALARIAAAIVVTLILLGSLAIPEVQAFVRSILRIGSIEIVVATPTPTPIPASTADVTPALTLTPQGSPPSWTNNLAGRTTLSEARQRVSFTIRLPAYPLDQGEPDQVFVQNLDGQAVILGWTDPTTKEEPRLALYELSSSVIGQKSVNDTIQLQETTVHGQKAAWVNGPHVLEIYVGQSARRRWTQLRLVQGNALIWEEGGITYRLETKLPLEEARLIAESLR